MINAKLYESWEVNEIRKSVSCHVIDGIATQGRNVVIFVDPKTNETKEIDYYKIWELFEKVNNLIKQYHIRFTAKNGDILSMPCWIEEMARRQFLGALLFKETLGIEPNFFQILSNILK